MSEFPQGWAEATLGSLASKIVDGSHNPPSKMDAGKPMLSARNIRDGQVVFDEYRLIEEGAFEHEHRRTRIKQGDVLLTIVGAIGRTAVVQDDTPFALQRSVAVIGDFGPIEPRFLAKALESPTYQQWLLENAKGTAQKGVYLKSIASSKVPVAPLSEQRRIVAKIDSLTGKSRRVRDHLDHIPRLVEKYKQAVLAAAFRGELTRDWRAQNGVCIDIEVTRRKRAAAKLDRRREKALSQLPERGAFEHAIPSMWRWVSIEELASDEPRAIQSGPFGSALLHSEFVSQGRLVIGIDNVQDGYFAKGAQNRISDAKFAELIRFAARPNDVLITVMATIGRVCVLPADLEQAIITKHVYRITVDDRCALPEFIAYGLRGSEAALSHMGANVRGQTRPGLNGEIIKSLLLPVPPLREQREIVRVIKSAFDWIDRLATEATGARRLIDRLDQAVLAKAFRGELVPQDPSDEPARVLLDRISAERGAAPKARRGRGPEAA
ncbi:restriction endonuclease subunit S [Aminobacter sp. NyZ550]|uniref:restriction endonuclease subunit S n=1 Tax=Aminobacter sp. NyZ550 TaxID=2979870 RepID=UPI0021D5A1ED|nr:restriction endonuclease subunit S [Aminobacter sp. NyZ550]WAX97313.1 restriction endonuclease subunit S [Aminobacter sp. NyZ550]